MSGKGMGEAISQVFLNHKTGSDGQQDTFLVIGQWHLKGRELWFCAMIRLTCNCSKVHPALLFFKPSLLAGRGHQKSPQLCTYLQQYGYSAGAWGGDTTSSRSVSNCESFSVCQCFQGFIHTKRKEKVILLFFWKLRVSRLWSCKFNNFPLSEMIPAPATHLA